MHNTLTKMLVLYFKQRARAAGSAFICRDRVLQQKTEPHTRELPLLNMAAVENCFGYFGDFAATVRRAMELKVMHELSFTAIAGNLRRERLPWRRPLNRRNVIAEMAAMECGLEEEAKRRGLLRREAD
jgi:hypothetical protein